MKIGLLSDIHGNSRALRAVLDSARERGVEVLCVTGDLVGYYYHPEEVLDLLAPWKTCRIQGNHERMLALVLAIPTLLPELELRYGHGLRRAIEGVPAEELDALCKLPQQLSIELGGKKILLSHGTPWDADAYVYPDADDEVWQKFESYGADLAVHGHTHYAMQRRSGGTLIVNPGSVGQPRDGRPGAAWALYDTDSGECVHFVEPYDIDAVLAEVMQYDPLNPYMRDILKRQ